jgi:hypothetical protein
MPCISDLLELLKKIGRSTDKVHLEADYDGREFKWKVTRANITASDWSPRHPRRDEEGSEHMREPVSEITGHH